MAVLSAMCIIVLCVYAWTSCVGSCGLSDILAVLVRTPEVLFIGIVEVYWE